MINCQYQEVSLIKCLKINCILETIRTTDTKFANKGCKWKIPANNFFFYQGFLHRHWRFTGQQGKGGDHLLFHSTTSTRWRTLGHLFACEMTITYFWSQRLCLPDCYSMRFTTLSNYHLNDWLMMQCLFVYLINWY